jgi:hypothetical protein
VKAAIAIFIALLLALAGCGEDSEADGEVDAAYADEVEAIVETEVDTAATKAADALVNVLQGGEVGEAEEALEQAARQIADAETHLGELDPPGAAAPVHEILLTQLADFEDYLAATPVATDTASGRVDALHAHRDGIDALALAASDVATYDEP